MTSTHSLYSEPSLPPGSKNLNPGSGQEFEYVPTKELKPHPDNPRAHSKQQIRKIAESIRAFGFRIPVVIDEGSRLIAGHARVEAAKIAGIDRVPALRVSDLSDEQIRGLMIADNRLCDLSTWDDQLLAENFKFLADLELDFEIESIGFDYGDIEQRILGLEGDEDAEDAPDDLPDPDSVPIVTRPGDLWRLEGPAGCHRILCADSTLEDSYRQLLGDERASMVFTDPPYNLPARVIGQVCASSHGNFAMGSGEMSSAQFEAFLGEVMSQLCAFSSPGSIHFHFMDWRHAREILGAGNTHYSELKNICVWMKDRPGMGSFYRSQHELVFVFKHGEASHQNNFELGQYGRNRSNVWAYPSVRSLDSADGDPESREALNLHPTIKPARLIEEAILDCSRRGEVILDPFLGSGSTLIASERARRRLFGLEISPRYVDVAISRWQAWTDGTAVLDSSGETFASLAEKRGMEASDD